MRIMALHFFRSHDKPISLYQLVDGCEVAVWAHTICLRNLDKLWNFRDQINMDLNARKCWKVWKHINNHFPTEITSNRSNIILNRFLNIPATISEPSNPVVLKRVPLGSLREEFSFPGRKFVPRWNWGKISCGWKKLSFCYLFIQHINVVCKFVCCNGFQSFLQFL